MEPPKAWKAELEEQERALHMGAGRAISRWAVLETTLLHTFAAFTKMPLRTSAAVFVQVKTFALMLDLVDAAVREAIENSKPKRRVTPLAPERPWGNGTIGLKHWTSLVEYLRELSGDRNYVAHVPVTMHFVGRHGEYKRFCMVGPPAAPYHAGLGVDPKHPPLDAREVEELAEDFLEANRLVIDFRDAFQTHGPLPQRYFEPVVRRRPRRSERLAAAGRVPKGRRRSSPE